MLLCHLRLGCHLVSLGAGNQPRDGDLIVVKANDEVSFVGGKCLEVGAGPLSTQIVWSFITCSNCGGRLQ